MPKRGFRVLAGILCVIVLALAITRIDLSRASTFYARELSNSPAVHTVRFDGEEFTVRRGTVTDESGKVVTGSRLVRALKIAYARAIAQSNPLFSLEGTDLARFQEGIALLQKLASNEADVQKNKQDADSVRDLYPVSYLRALAVAESERRAFIADASEARAKAYSSAVSDSITAGLASLRAHRLSFTSVVPLTHPKVYGVPLDMDKEPDDVGTYGQPGGIVSRASVVRSMDSIEDRFKELSRHQSERSRCLKGLIYACRQDEILPAVPLVPTVPDSAASLPLPEMRAVLAKMTLDPAFATNPAIVLRESTCAGALDLQPLFFLRKGKSAEREEAVFFAGDIIATRVPETAFPFFRALKERNIQHLSYWPVVYYRCPTITIDTGRVRAVEAIALHASEAPFSEDVSPQSAPLLHEFEKRLRNSPVKESDALGYLKEARETILRDPNASQEAFRELSTLILMARDGSRQFEEFLRTIAVTEEDNRRLEASGIPFVHIAKFLYFIRDPFFALFLAGQDASQVTTPLESTTLPAKHPFLFYSRESKESRSRIMSDLREYHLLHQDVRE